MSREFVRPPLLDKFYQEFLSNEQSADFVDCVSRHYCIDTLMELAQRGARSTRRAAVLALGFLGDYGALESLGRSLHDRDRAVRMLADHGLRQVWFRQGTPGEQLICRRAAILNGKGLFDQAIDWTTRAIAENDLLAEAWNQRALAYYSLSEYEQAISNCQEALYLNRYHFLAAIGLANSYLQLDSVTSALEAFRLALTIHPDLESVRGQILQLEKILDD